MTSAARFEQGGLSLIELMVAITIGLFLLAGAVTIFINSKRTYNEQQDVSRIQENLRFATETISRDLRMAGYFGCAFAIEPPTLGSEGRFRNHLRTDGTVTASAGGAELVDVTRGKIEGSESAGNWLPSNTAANIGGAAIVAGTDAITIRHAGGSTWQLPVDSTTTSIPFNNVPVNGEMVVANDLLMISDCGRSELVRVNPPTTASTALSRDYPHNPGGQVDDPNFPFVSKATFVRYYIGTDANGERGLFRQFWNSASSSVTTDVDAGGIAVPYVAGVENMQITYGIDTDGDNIVNQFVTADNVGAGNWDRVLSVRVGLLVRSTAANAPETDTIVYAVNDVNVGPMNDQRKRRALTTTVFLRN
jgi:type IV pilus assembly protein PilW